MSHSQSNHLSATDGPIGIEEQQSRQGGLFSATQINAFLAIPYLKRTE